MGELQIPSLRAYIIPPSLPILQTMTSVTNIKYAVKTEPSPTPPIPRCRWAPPLVHSSMLPNIPDRSPIPENPVDPIKSFDVSAAIIDPRPPSIPASSLTAQISSPDLDSAMHARISQTIMNKSRLLLSKLIPPAVFACFCENHKHQPPSPLTSNQPPSTMPAQCSCNHNQPASSSRTTTTPSTGPVQQRPSGPTRLLETQQTHPKPKLQLPPLLRSQLPPLPTGPIPNRVLQHFLAKACAWTPPAWQPTEFQFQWTDKAAGNNFDVLQRYGWDLSKAVHAQPYSVVTLGSEFRPVHLLAPLMYQHPLWPNAHKWLTEGVSFPMSSLSSEDQREDLEAMLERGNHQSAKRRPTLLTPALKEEVNKGWMLPLPISAARMLPGAVIAPMGIADRTVLDELSGELVVTHRLTHDQSFNVVKTTKRSVNDRLLPDSLTPCKFGRTMSRLLHTILEFRRHSPSEQILIVKADGKAAYRRMHLHGQQAVQSLVLCGDLVLLALRMTFGGAANPSRWSDISELMCDVANDIVRHPGWDHATMQSPNLAVIDSSPAQLNDNIPFAPSTQLNVDIPYDLHPKCDVYLDDLIGIGLARDSNRLAALLPFVVHLFGRPVNAHDDVPRDDLLSIKKFLHEGRPSETQIVLGWTLDTRRLLILLPPHKVIAWSASIQSMLDEPTKVTAPMLASLIGRLSNAGCIIPEARHFLSRLRQAEYVAAKRQFVSLTDPQIQDLHLWLSYLQYAGAGVPMLNLAFRDPTVFHRSDACLHGIGGYNLRTGLAWRWGIPLELRMRTTLNCLEFIASYVTVAIDIEVGSIQALDTIHAGTDSSTAAGWIHKSNFSEDNSPVQLLVARTLAAQLLSIKATLHACWLPGRENQVADALSRDHHLDDASLTTLMFSHCRSQIPVTFKICPVPQKVLCCVTTWLRNMPSSSQSPPIPTRSGIGTSVATSSSSKQLSLITTPSSINSLNSNEPASSEPSSTRTVKGDLPLLQELISAKRTHAATLWHRWWRPIGSTCGRTQLKTSPGSSTNFFGNN